MIGGICPVLEISTLEKKFLVSSSFCITSLLVPMSKKKPVPWTRLTRAAEWNYGHATSTPMRNKEDMCTWKIDNWMSLLGTCWLLGLRRKKRGRKKKHLYLYLREIYIKEMLASLLSRFVNRFNGFFLFFIFSIREFFDLVDRVWSADFSTLQTEYSHGWPLHWKHQ